MIRIRFRLLATFGDLACMHMHASLSMSRRCFRYERAEKTAFEYGVVMVVYVYIS